MKKVFVRGMRVTTPRAIPSVLHKILIREPIVHIPSYKKGTNEF